MTRISFWSPMTLIIAFNNKVQTHKSSTVFYRPCGCVLMIFAIPFSDMSRDFLGIHFSAGKFRAAAQKDVITNFEQQFSVINMYGWHGWGVIYYGKCNYYALINCIRHCVRGEIKIKFIKIFSFLLIWDKNLGSHTGWPVAKPLWICPCLWNSDMIVKPPQSFKIRDFHQISFWYYANVSKLIKL